jgi:Hemerythrin HHE cation binding domain
MVAELLWVHDALRRDLATVRRMAAEVAAGAPAAQITAGIRSLAANGALWHLKINCLRYCRFVHAQHTLESAMLFPELRRLNPALSAVVDKLEADHGRVAGLLDDVGAAAQALGERDDPQARERLSGALQRLSTDLLAHLSYEEEHISDTLRTPAAWPRW